MIWDRVDKELKRKCQVNVGHIQKHIRDGESAVIPGKVLGVGVVSKPLTVYANQYSASAKVKIEAAGGKALTLAQGKKGTKLRLLK